LIPADVFGVELIGWFAEVLSEHGNGVQVKSNGCLSNPGQPGVGGYRGGRVSINLNPISPIAGVPAALLQALNDRFREIELAAPTPTSTAAPAPSTGAPAGPFKRLARKACVCLRPTRKAWNHSIPPPLTRLVLGCKADVDPGGGRLVVNEEEAERVRAIFALFEEYGSARRTLAEIERRGWRLKSWTLKTGL
jgi:hypothetical protein